MSKALDRAMRGLETTAGSWIASLVVAAGLIVYPLSSEDLVKWLTQLLPPKFLLVVLGLMVAVVLKMALVMRRIHVERNDAFRVDDRARYRMLRQQLGGTVATSLKEHNHGSPLQQQVVEVIHEALGARTDADRRFLDHQLELARSDLMTALQQYSTVVANQMWATNYDDGLLHVPPEWKVTQHNRYYNAVAELDRCARAAWRAYDALVAMASIRLAPVTD